VAGARRWASSVARGVGGQPLLAAGDVPGRLAGTALTAAALAWRSRALGGAARALAAAVNRHISASMFSASGWCTRKRSAGSSGFRMGGMPRFSAAAIRAREHFAAGPVAGFAVRSRRPPGGDPGNEKPSARRARGRPAARNRLPERVSGFKWNLRGTGDPSRRSDLPVLHARRDLSLVRLFHL
jgi:hypothetical protein